MPRGDKSSYTGKQKRQARHIEKSYEDRGVSKSEAEERAWRTVNKQDQGGKQSGSGRAAKSAGHSGKAKTTARATSSRAKRSGSGKSRSADKR